MRAHKNHRHVAMEDRPFRCDYNCGMSFPYEGERQAHHQRHADRRAFECPVPGCTYAANTLPDLKKHEGHQHTANSIMRRRKKEQHFADFLADANVDFVRERLPECKQRIKSLPYRFPSSSIGRNKLWPLRFGVITLRSLPLQLLLSLLSKARRL